MCAGEGQHFLCVRGGIRRRIHTAGSVVSGGLQPCSSCSWRKDPRSSSPLALCLYPRFLLYTAGSQCEAQATG